MKNSASIYFLTNTYNNVLYIGVTNDLVRRIAEHKTKINKGFTTKYNCDKLVYYEIFALMTDTIDREKQLKNWKREWKNKLVNDFNPKWEDLSRAIGVDDEFIIARKEHYDCHFSESRNSEEIAGQARNDGERSRSQSRNSEGIAGQARNDGGSRKGVNYITWLLIAATVLFAACQKEIKVTLPDYNNKVVIEGYIENGQPAVVMITRSMPYFSDIDTSSLRKIFINNATVTVTSSSGESEQLIFDMEPDFSPIYFAYVSPTLRGEEGKTYTLKVKLDGQEEYSAVTSILHPFALDSIGFASFMNRDTSLSIRALMTDNPATTDYYRFQVKVHGKKLHDRLWASSMPVVFDDLTFRGMTMNVEVLRAIPTRLFLEDMTDEQRREYNRMTYRKGDTIYVKYSRIDYDSYRYWITASGELNGGNPFMSPAPIVSNIKGDNVLGVWCGYASKVDTLYFR